MKQVAAREAISLLRVMTRVLCAVGLLALAFTTVNVTRFATTRDVPLPIALLLDPMIGTALAGVVYVDARLASWGMRPPAWSTVLRWGAGCIAALMNTWESLWPDGQIGWPHQADPAAVLLHLTPALLLIALTETIAAYRRTLTQLLDTIGPADPLDPAEGPTPTTATQPRSAPEYLDPPGAEPDRTTALPPDGGPSPEPAPGHAPASGGAGPDKPTTGDHAPDNHPVVPSSEPAGDEATDADVWPRALVLDAAARATTGKPVSIWRLRTELHIGPSRARQIRDQLLTHSPDPPHPAR